MSKDYFTPVNFNEKPTQIKPEEKPFPAKHEWSKALDMIWEEVGKIESGGSRFFKTGVQIKHNQPALATLHRFAQSPSKEQYEALLQVLPQDFGSASVYFIKLLNAVMEKDK